ncbi:MAG: hypothetical protein JAZ05_16010, partial [Candidatus Thiodiazotropha taylori]|nr:hypothetical protein [Candidatus Thiodiazotropha taylori]MCW4293521.1 hypothetical protein [Candidatus Thiodiazotropha taylori]
TTPIIYPVEMIPQSFRPLIEGNPLTWLVEAYRAVILEQSWPVDNLMIVGLSALIIMILSGALFSRLQHRAKDFL